MLKLNFCKFELSSVGPIAKASRNKLKYDTNYIFCRKIESFFFYKMEDLDYSSMEGYCSVNC